MSFPIQFFSVFSFFVKLSKANQSIESFVNKIKPCAYHACLPKDVWATVKFSSVNNCMCHGVSGYFGMGLFSLQVLRLRPSFLVALKANMHQFFSGYFLSSCVSNFTIYIFICRHFVKCLLRWTTKGERGWRCQKQKAFYLCKNFPTCTSDFQLLIVNLSIRE